MTEHRPGQRPGTSDGRGGAGRPASHDGRARRPGNAPYEGRRSDATRLLCAGVHLDSDFRRRVIQELVLHEERPVAPSLGVDALPVLAHALRARRAEVRTALMLLVLWILFIGLGFAGVGSEPLLPLPWWLGYALVCVLLGGVRVATGLGVALFTLDRRMVEQATSGRLKMLLPVLPAVAALTYWVAAVFALVSGTGAWTAVVLPLLLTLPVWAYRSHVTRVMRTELGSEDFPGMKREPLPDTARYRRIAGAIAREQYATLTIYDPFRPFIGAGRPYEEPWSLVMELRKRDGGRADGLPGPRPEPDSGTAAGPLTGREVIDLIKPQLEALRTSAAASGRDRLRALEVEEFVYLPTGSARWEVDYGPSAVDQHLAEAVGEGAEGRRHFLRIRVGAWDEQIVVSVLVRVHTQGGMLVLEVVPHVLTPVRPEFQAVDVIEARGEPDPLRDAVRAVLATPAANFAAGTSLANAVMAEFRTWLANPRRAFPDGPVTSVRELGSTAELSVFQEMDVKRYVRTVQDRIATGVREALRAKNYETGDFERQVVTVSGGGVFIGTMHGGAVATGEGASAAHGKGDIR
ncbi:hypothetical protein ACF08W_33045 [Streptomyces sp. NPDC015144]|uniref:hypothetical protein n=1 Tax=Streptomyces sp. NPDC015144 TaxID=3364944 RepID=UPI0036FD5878